MALRDIVGSLGVIPRMLARRDQEKSDEISRLRSENEAARKMSSQAANAEGAPLDVTAPQPLVMKKKGGMIKSSASKRADGCAIKGKTRGRMV